jgi:8-oxo-dGTP diphosphatase
MTRRAFSVAIFARDRQGRVLLIKHKRLGTWLPVGGEVEAGETPLEAAMRELREETGLEGKFTAVNGVDGTPPGYIAYEEHMAGSKGLHMNFCFTADVDGEPNSDDSWGEYRWVTSTVGLECPPNVSQLVNITCGGIARQWLRAFNAKDLDALLALYGDDAVHTSPKLRDRKPETKGEIRGKAALRAWWADAFERLPGLTYDEIAVTSTGERVFLEYTRRVPGEADLVVAELFIVRDGLIRESRVFHG